MIRKIIMAVSLISLIMSQAACKKIKGKGDVITESRAVSGYTAIDLSVSGDVYFTPDLDFRLTLEGQQNVLDVIETQIEGSNLVIKLKDHYTLGTHEPLKVNIHAPNIKQLLINGAGSFNVQSVWAGNVLGVGISGSGDMYLGDIQAHQVKANISGSGSIHGNGGITDNLDLNISGSGSMDFQYLSADTVYASISGSGDMWLWAGKLLDGTISGSGNIYYKGTPVIYSNISGSGSIKPI